MTTWYTVRPVGRFAGRHDTRVRAYSVRPDIWPAGTKAWRMTSGRPGSRILNFGNGNLADWTLNNRAMTPDQHGEAPGVAEALVLGDLVGYGRQDPAVGPWTPVSP